MKKILLIDDEINIRNAIKRMLKENLPSVMVIDTSESEDVVKLAFRHLPGLILLDLKMPGLNGLQVLNLLKGNESTVIRRIPVIMLTGVCNQEIILKVKKIGAADYITKPFDEKVFLKKIEKYIK